MFLYYIFLEGGGEIDLSLLVKENDSGRAVENFMTYFSLDDVFDGNLLIYRLPLDDIPMGALGWEQKGGMEYIGNKTVSEWVSGKTQEENFDFESVTIQDGNWINDPLGKAAPDMLKVLKRFASVFGENLDDPDEPLNGGDAVDELCKLWPAIKAVIARAEGLS